MLFSATPVLVSPERTNIHLSTDNAVIDSQKKTPILELLEVFIRRVKKLAPYKCFFFFFS
jgi:hypothetical protein